MDGVYDRAQRLHGIKGGENANASSLLTPSPPYNNNTSPINSPPYWAQSHNRGASQVSLDSILPGGITLHDNTTANSDTNAACWAKSVAIDDHAVVNGSRTGIGAFVVWNIKIETLSGSTISIRKRYSEFNTLRQNLLMTFPLSEASMPPLPPKGVVSKFRPKFLEQRRVGLQYFLNCVLLNPEFSSSPIMKDFLFS